MSHCYIAYVHDQQEPDHKIIKVGHSKNLVQRFKALSAMAWREPHEFEATLWIGGQRGCEIEYEMHQLLRRHEIKREWFYVPTVELTAAKQKVERIFKTRFLPFDLDEEGFVLLPTEYPQEQAA